jgi:spermidine/putrescine transport system substrate-binding protein
MTQKHHQKHEVIALLLLVFSLFTSVLPLMAQDGEAAEIALEPWVCPEGFEGQTLSVYNWTTYIAEDTISNFIELCSLADVTYDTYASNEDLLAAISQGNPGYDIIVPTDEMVALMIERELLDTLDKNNIPNLANVSPDLLGAPHDPENNYSVPYQWGTIGIAYNIEKVGVEITSWQELFAYEGSVAWLEDPRAMMAIALQLLGFDPNSENPDEIAQARDFLIANGNNVRTIAQDDGQALLERGDVDITIEYSGDIFQVIYECECDTYRYVIPQDGGIIWTDNMAIPVDAPNKALAEVFIDYILDPQVGADISNYTAYGSPNQVAIDAGLIDGELLDDPTIYPPADIREKLFFIKDVSDEAQMAYNDAWDETLVLVPR